MSKMLTTWLERVEAHEIRESHITQLKNAIASRADGWKWGGQRTNITEAEAKRIMLTLRIRVARDGGPLVTEAQAQKGRDWIMAHGKRMGVREEYRTGITHFRLRGIRKIPHPIPGGRPGFAPIYRAYYADGRRMTYSPTPRTAREKSPSFTYDESHARVAC